MNSSLRERLKRLLSFFTGKYKYWLELNFLNARRSRNPIQKIYFYLKSGVYRQSKIENIILTIGLLLNKI